MSVETARDPTRNAAGLLLKHGKVIWNASHFRITASELDRVTRRNSRRRLASCPVRLLLPQPRRAAHAARIAVAWPTSRVSTRRRKPTRAHSCGTRVYSGIDVRQARRRARSRPGSSMLMTLASARASRLLVALDRGGGARGSSPAARAPRSRARVSASPPTSYGARARPAPDRNVSMQPRWPQ